MQLKSLYEDVGRGQDLSDVVRAASETYKKFKKPFTPSDIKSMLRKKSPDLAQDENVVNAVNDALRVHGVEVVGAK